MKTIKTTGFDAVAASRQWKEAVARQTEGLERDQVLAFFDKESLLTALQDMREPAPPVARPKKNRPAPL